MGSGRRAALLLGALAWPLAASGQTHDHDTVDSTGPRFSLRGFADVDFFAPWGDPPPGESENRSAFALGQFDLYMVSRLTDSISFLGETVFELNEDQESVVDVERLQIAYRWSDALRVTAGRGHTALGYWNESYHHGALLEPTVDRPEALKFEDDGGILPVHFVGLEASGRKGRGDWDLTYVGYVANGRGIQPDVVQGAFDANRSKAVGGKLSLAREGRYSLRFGASAYHDVIPPDGGPDGRQDPLNETILGAHLVVQSTHLRLFSEYFHLHHEDQQTRASFVDEAAYAIGVFQSGRWSPYAGIDWMSVDPADPYFVGYSSLTRGLVGLRFDVAAFNALKLEYQHDDRSGAVSHTLVLQSAFTF
jgi:hypothetical protein